MRPPAESRCSALCQRRPPGRRARTSATPTPERAPRSSRRASSRALSGNPANRRNAVAIASASWVPEPSPACAGMAFEMMSFLPVSRPRLSAMRRARCAPRSRSSPKTSKLGASAKMNAGLERVDGETNRSEPSAKIPGEIEKTQMQTRRRRDLNAFQLRASSPRSIRRLRLRRIHRNIAKLCARLPSARRDVARQALAGRGLRSSRRVRWRPGSDLFAMLRSPVQNATLAG